MSTRGSDGQYVRTHQHWSLEHFDDGYVDATGRMRVYFPGHPRASRGGYVLRAIVVYEAYHAEPVTTEFNIHHKDTNRLNDSKDNLVKLTHERHSSLHHPRQRVQRVCKTCHGTFEIKPYRLKETGRGSYCSHTCYQKAPRSSEHRGNISKGLQLAYAAGRR